MSKNSVSLARSIPVFLILIVVTSSCGKSPAETPLPPALPVLNAESVLSKGEVCSGLIQAETKAWQSEDAESLRDVYTEDVIHYDGGPAYVGIDEVMHMAENMWIYFSKWEMKAGNAYISQDKCFGEWQNWNIFGFTADAPGVEYDWLEYNDQGIYFWRLFYDRNFQKAFNASDRIDEEFLNQYAAAWSEKNPSEIASLYASDAHVEDTLFSVDLNTSQEVADFASAFKAQFPGAMWQLIDSFAEESAGPTDKEEYPFTYQGGVFSIELSAENDSNCEVQAIVLLAPDEEGKIESQKVFYEASSLVNCGLAQ